MGISDAIFIIGVVLFLGLFGLAWALLGFLCVFFTGRLRVWQKRYLPGLGLGERTKPEGPLHIMLVTWLLRIAGVPIIVVGCGLLYIVFKIILEYT